MAKRINVVVSQGQSKNPHKRDLEESIVAALLMENGIDVTVVPHLYDLSADDTGMLALQGIAGDMVVLCWLFDRAARWTLDRNGIRGQEGQTLLQFESDDDEDDSEEEETADSDEDKHRVVDERELPNRKIYCLDLRSAESAQPFIDEIKRIAAESGQQVVDLMDWVGGAPQPEQMQRFVQPTNDTALGGNGNGQSSAPPAAEPQRVGESAGRRWYPVIDFSRCTNCMECIDFCLFGVYGVDRSETILVEQPDNCRKGCPACSRVCPENAIIFPQHKTPAIAGSADAVAGLKIDLSQLFGSPDSGKSAGQIAAEERDEQLLLAGREAVGLTPSRRQPTGPPAEKDELDNLIDSLDELDL